VNRIFTLFCETEENRELKERSDVGYTAVHLPVIRTNVSSRGRGINAAEGEYDFHWSGLNFQPILI